jgi:hypothetical protein
MLYAIRIADIPNVIIAFIIGGFLLSGLISLWKSNKGMPDWVVYSLFVGIVLFSSVAGHFICKAASLAWKEARRKH